MTHEDYDDPHRLASAGVVVGVDGSLGSELALRWAASYAAQRRRELQIVHALDLGGVSSSGSPSGVVPPSLIDTVRARGQQLVREAEEMALRIEPGLRTATRISVTNASRLLVELSSAAYAVVLGATGNAGTLIHLGSTLFAVTSHAHSPVIVVRPDPDAHDTLRETGPVVVGVDGSPVSEAAIATAFAEAAERHADLVAVHVWSDWDFGEYLGDRAPADLVEVDGLEQALLTERLAGFQEKYPDVQVTRRIYVSAPADKLQGWSKHAQLVVVGNRGRGGFTGMLLGSTTHTLVQHAHCPIMVVRPAE
ncbi:universal stress protein [Nocardia sp. NPDC101769]|uniref:universal stress protein n=1 Tax=Nocardia sp. NPDC101769 TaxID=3364333 RepID=UPI0037FD3C10